MSSTPRLEGAQGFYALVNAIDDASADARRWPTVVSKLTTVLPLQTADLPPIFPSRPQVEQLLHHRDAKSWSNEHIELLHFLCTRLERAAAMHDRLAEAQVRSRAAAKALNHALRAIVVVNKNAKLITTNAPADEILAQRDGLYIDREYLKCSTSNADVELRRCIAIVASRKFRWVSCCVPRTTGSENLTLVLSPNYAMMRADDHEDLIVVTITSPSRRLCLDPDVLCQMYLLTPSEARLACRLAAGDTVEHAAEHLGISSNTARTHLKHIFMKTDTSRQSHLVLLLVQHTADPSSIVSPMGDLSGQHFFRQENERRKLSSSSIGNA